MISIVLSINGREEQLHIEEKWTLLTVLREVLELTGTKYGCGTNDCGACKVLIDGEPKNSCVLLAKNLVGKEILTIEGVGKDGGLHPVQKAFVEAGAIQCGFCTPGMVMTSLSLLQKNPNPTKDEVAVALENNLCRCTGYKKIIDAVLLAADEMKGEA